MDDVDGRDATGGGEEWNLGWRVRVREARRQLRVWVVWEGLGLKPKEMCGIGGKARAMVDWQWPWLEQGRVARWRGRRE
jgi:hypothetical protein